MSIVSAVGYLVVNACFGECVMQTNFCMARIIGGHLLCGQMLNMSRAIFVIEA
jgi:hypothetical protein